MMRFHRTLTPNREKGAHVSLIEIILLCYHIKNLIFVFLSKPNQIKTKTFVVDEFVERREEKSEKLLITVIFIKRFFCY